MIDAFVKSGMTLLYDNDRDIINYSNVIMFEDPIFNSVYMQFSFEFKDGSRYESVINYSDVGKVKNQVGKKCKKFMMNYLRFGKRMNLNCINHFIK